MEGHVAQIERQNVPHRFSSLETPDAHSQNQTSTSPRYQRVGGTLSLWRGYRGVRSDQSNAGSLPWSLAIPKVKIEWAPFRVKGRVPWLSQRFFSFARFLL